MKRRLVMMAVLATAGMGFAPAAEPAEAALEFASRLRNEEVAMQDLLKGTALSPYCGEKRKKAISWYLGGLARRLRTQPHRISLMEEKRDGEYAAVLLSLQNKHDPLDVDVVALGMAKVDGEWKPAPMPGSFDNVELGFDPEIVSSVDKLELWMGAERIRRLRDLEDEALQDFRERMAKAVPDPLLEKSNPRQYVEALIAACREGNLHATMRLLGDFEDGFTEEDRDLHRTISRGLQGLDERGHWRLLTSPDVVRVLVPQKNGDDLDADVPLLVFDPLATEPVSLLRFVLLRVGKRWEIELPDTLRLADVSRIEFQRAIWRQQDPDDDDLCERFEEFFEAQHAPRRPSDLAEAGRQIERVLREGTLGELFPYMHRSESPVDAERRSAYRRFLAEFWLQFRGESSAAGGELVEVIQEGKTAVLVFHLVSTEWKSWQEVSLVPLLVMQDTDGWSIAPGVSSAGNHAALSKARQDEQDRVMATFQERREELAKEAVASFLGRFAAADPKMGGTISHEEAATLVKTFRDRLRNSKLLEAFECCAVLDPKEGAWEALKELSYEYRGTQTSREPDHVLKVASEGPWAAVSLRLDAGANINPVYPMYLVAPTGEGPRIVVDVSLRLADNKGREVINSRQWGRLEDRLDPDQTALVRKLFQGHVEESKADLAWQKNNK